MCLKAWNWEVTPMYHTSFFMIFLADHNGASLVHDLHDFSWPFCMILHFLGGIPLHITHHFSCFFEPVTIVLVLCMIFMILHDHISWFCIFWELYPYISYIIFHNFLSQWWYSCAWFAWFCMTIFHDFAWFSNCWDVHPHVSHIIFHDFLSQLLCWYSCAWFA